LAVIEIELKSGERVHVKVPDAVMGPAPELKGKVAVSR